MSIFDLFSSVNVALQSFAAPADTSRRLWAVGNDTTCSAAGYFFQLALPSYIYSFVLSVYYVCTLRFEMNEAK
jgi:hypothetical protein